MLDKYERFLTVFNSAFTLYQFKTITSFQTSKMMKEKQNHFRKWQEPQ